MRADLEGRVVVEEVLEPSVALVPADSFEALAAEIGAWQDEQFPNASPESIAVHLLQEAREVLVAPTDAEEAADVLHLLVGLARVVGFDLVAATRAKFERNKLRKWGEPDEFGVVRHVAEGER